MIARRWLFFLLPVTVSFAFLTAFAGGDLSSSKEYQPHTAKQNTGQKAYIHPSTAQRSGHFKGSYNRPAIISFYTGSLRANIERIGREHGWSNVVWDIPNDYQWVGNTKITAPSLQDALSRALQDYPVQAIFYLGNHVLLVRPRTLR